MKKVLLLITGLMVFTVALAACSGSSTGVVSEDTTTNSNTSQMAESLSQVNKLLVGTLMLKETEQDVTKEEATKLLPLWQAYRSLSNSDTSAQAEVDALLNQIQGTMTAEQVKAIEAMNLTAQDMVDTMQSMGGGMVIRGTPDPNSTPVFEIPSGGFDAGEGPGFEIQGGAGAVPERSFGGRNGAPPAGGGIIVGGGPMGDAGSEAGLGGGPFMQGTPDPSMRATAQARFSNQASEVNPFLLQLLINNLETKASE